MGRTGTFLACEQFGLKPDLVTLAKGLGGAGVDVAHECIIHGIQHSAAACTDDRVDVYKRQG